MANNRIQYAGSGFEEFEEYPTTSEDFLTQPDTFPSQQQPECSRISPGRCCRRNIGYLH